MAQIPCRVNTQSINFPTLSQLSGRTIIYSGKDQTYVPGVNPEGGSPLDRGIPGIVYGHNVMPSTYGWQSVSYTEQYVASEPAADFYDIWLIFQGESQAGGSPESPDLRIATGLRGYIALARYGENQPAIFLITSQSNNSIPAYLSSVTYNIGDFVTYTFQCPTWSPSEDYDIGDIVISGGIPYLGLYLALAANTGVVPADGATWKLLGILESSSDIVTVVARCLVNGTVNVIPTTPGDWQLIVKWNTVSDFLVGDFTYKPDYSLYTALTNNTDQDPASNPDDWQAFAPPPFGDGSNLWRPSSVTLAESTDLPLVTTADINGITYVYIQGAGCYYFNNFADDLLPLVLSGLDSEAVLGITATNGYMLAYTKSGIAWSSVVDPTDFVPSDVTGAGGGQLQEAKGAIVFAVPTSLGVIFYCDGNAVSCLFSGNTNFPFNFKAISSSGGIASYRMVAREVTGGIHTAYTSNGMQRIGHPGADTIFPAITDFLAGGIFEDYDYGTDTVDVTVFDWTMAKRVAIVSDRYIVISYGLQPTLDFTHAWVIDTAQGRVGKLRIQHRAAFELRNLLPEVIETPRKSLAFLGALGNIKVVDFGLADTEADTILILGKYQYVRQYWLVLQELNLENVTVGSNFACYSLPTLDGKNFQPPITGYLMQEAENFRQYLFDQPGLNHGILFKGTFNIHSMEMFFTLGGRY